MPSRKPQGQNRLRQLHLGATDDNQLTLLEHKHQRHPVSPPIHYEADPELFAVLPFAILSSLEIQYVYEPPFPILLLPEELIDNILKQAISISQRKRHGYMKISGLVLSLCLSCKLFHRLMQPVLYSSIEIWEIVPLHPSSEKLHRTLCANRSLAQHCQELILNTYKLPSSLQEFYLVKELCGWFVNVRSFTMCGGVDNGDLSSNNAATANELAWTFLPDVLKSMAKIQELQFLSPRGGYALGMGVWLNHLCATIGGLRHLRSLYLYGISPQVGKSEFVLPKNLEGSASFTRLTIDCCDETLSALSELIKWPSKLEHFHLRRLYRQLGTGLSSIVSLLYRHRNTLTSFSIGHLRGPPVDLSEFPNLESVGLDSYSILGEWDPETVCAKVIVPARLHTLIINFAYLDEQQCLEFDALTPQRAEWLQKLGYLSREQDRTLRSIELLYEVYFCDVDLTIRDVVDKLREDLGHLGITLMIKD
ncbi:hypothetical protein F5884DRAFT_850603 [Xylogone sp. PMI_703]|nr:hypothetical protein F5884DRAFT_850603 [Xylogone sp. PMI_703]